MNYGQIREYDIANGVGIRATLFVTGCSHHCYNCFNPEYWDHTAGNEFTKDVAETLVSYLKHPQVSGLTILGGEPFENVDGLVDFINTYLKGQEWFRNKDIWCYSGYTIDQIIEDPNKRKLLELVDVLVDGKFVDSLKDPSLKFRGSSNQNIYKIKHVDNHISANFYSELM